MFSVGSICSGIEAASVAWKPLNFDFKWFSEIADFPSEVLKIKYPDVTNLGDMERISEKILSEEIYAPDIICGGTPCQAFSFAGYQNGLNDKRGNLTLSFVDIVDSNDLIRNKQNKPKTIIFYENVEGILKDKTNAFGLFISALAGLSEPLNLNKYPSAGLLRGSKRNVAWRVLDAKYFGVPQQRKRVYLLAGGKDFNPDFILFEMHIKPFSKFPNFPLIFDKENHHFETFREYTDCLYSSYGTKWNGNAAAYNGSLFIVQDHRIRRLSPLECERLMGFPDNYTNIKDSKNTPRYQAIGNSWAIPVVRWLGERIFNVFNNSKLNKTYFNNYQNEFFAKDFEYFNLDTNSSNDGIYTFDNIEINCSKIPENCKYISLADIVDANAPNDIYISPVGCYGILRRKRERNLKINERLEFILDDISSSMSLKEIETRSRIQKRGKFSVHSHLFQGF